MEGGGISRLPGRVREEGKKRSKYVTKVEDSMFVNPECEGRL